MSKVNTKLAEKSCKACTGDMPALSENAQTQYLEQLKPDWNINNGHLKREYIFKNFVEALEFTNKVAEIAESESHHPAIYLTWGLCIIEIWTHKINNLTESDFILAAKVDTI